MFQRTERLNLSAFTAVQWNVYNALKTKLLTHRTRNGKKLKTTRPSRIRVCDGYRGLKGYPPNIHPQGIATYMYAGCAAGLPGWHRLIAASPFYRVLKLEGSKGDFRNFWSSEQLVDGCVSPARYDFLLVFDNELRCRWNRCWWRTVNISRTISDNNNKKKSAAGQAFI